METNPVTIVLIVLVVILLFISIAFKIRNDRKRKSLVNFSSEGDKEYYINTKRKRDKKPNLWGIPSWGQALLAMFLTFIILMVVFDIVGAIFKISEDSIDSNALLYILFGIIVKVK